MFIVTLFVWCSGLSCCLQYWHPILVPVCKPAVPLLIQILANEPGTAVEDRKSEKDINETGICSNCNSVISISLYGKNNNNPSLNEALSEKHLAWSPPPPRAVTKSTLSAAIATVFLPHHHHHCRYLIINILIKCWHILAGSYTVIAFREANDKCYILMQSKRVKNQKFSRTEEHPIGKKSQFGEIKGE